MEPKRIGEILEEMTEEGFLQGGVAHDVFMRKQALVDKIRERAIYGSSKDGRDMERRCYDEDD